MIVLNNKETAELKSTDMKHVDAAEHKMPHMSSEHKMPLEELFRKELDAYCAYEKWLDEAEDIVLEMALEEIMMDEYLHAKFLRDYLLDKDMYTLTDTDPHEKRFWKIQKKLFRD